MLHVLNGILCLTGGSSKLKLPIIRPSTSLGIVDFRTKWESFVIVSLLPHFKILTLKVPKSNSLKSAEFQHSVCFQYERFLQIHLGDLRRGSRASVIAWLASLISLFTSNSAEPSWSFSTCEPRRGWHQRHEYGAGRYLSPCA